LPPDANPHYISHFLRVNEEELGLLPPFKANNKIELSEMMEILRHSSLLEQEAPGAR
jgi:hypothetical protein